MDATEDRRYRFGVFEFDAKACELQKQGRPLRVRPQSLKLLAVLLSQGGELVPRDEIHRALWGRDTHVDFEQGVNHCIKELRTALGDAAESPRYIQTVPRRGYRFIAPIERLATAPALADALPPPAEKPARNLPPRLRVFALVASALMLVVVVATMPWRAPDAAAGPGAISIAALPLTSPSGDASDAYFAEGVTESLITELARTRSLAVIAPAAVFRYQNRGVGPRAVGSALGARYVLHGTVQRAGGRVRVNIRLLDVASGREVMGEAFDEATGDIFVIQNRIAARVAETLQLRVAASERGHVVRRPTTNEQAYEAYLKGMFYARHAASGSGERAIAFLRAAVEADPGFALAHAALGTQYMTRFFYADADPVLEQNAVVAVERALAADPELPEAYLARAQLVWTLPNRFPHERAIQDLEHAIALNPSLAGAHRELGKVYLHVGLLEESIEANTRAVQLNPGDVAASRRVLAHLYLRQCETALELLDQQGARNARRRAEVLRCLGRVDEALHELSVEPYPSLRAALLARTGQSDAARRELEKAQTVVTNAEELSHVHHAQYYMGAAHALLGDTRQAVSWLKKASSEGLPCYPLYERDPDLDSLRQDPEFVALLRQLEAQRNRLRSRARAHAGDPSTAPPAAR